MGNMNMHHEHPVFPIPLVAVSRSLKITYRGKLSGALLFTALFLWGVAISVAHAQGYLSNEYSYPNGGAPPPGLGAPQRASGLDAFDEGLRAAQRSDAEYQRRQDRYMLQQEIDGINARQYQEELDR